MLIKNGIPLYIQVKRLILKEIKNSFKANEIIPTETQLEKKYGVSRITIRKAIEELEKDGIVQKKQGIGTFVRESKISYQANFIDSLTQYLAKEDIKLTTSSIFFEIIEQDHFVKKLLNCKELLCIKRVRLLQGVPFALMTNYFDINKVPNIDKKFQIESLYEFLKIEYNIELKSANETIEAVAASKNEAMKLDVNEGFPLLSLKRLAFDKHDVQIEFSHLLFHSNMYKHNLNLVTK